MKNVRNIVELAMKFEKSNSNRLRNRSKQRLSTSFLETLPAGFE